MSASFSVSQRPDSTTWIGIVALSALLLFSSCVTVAPSPSFSVPAWVSAGQTVVLRVDAKQVQGFSALSKEFPALAPAVARTRVAWLSWSSQNSVKIALDGDFPRLVTSWTLFWNHPPSPWVVSQPTETVVVAQAASLNLSGANSFEDAALWPEVALRVVISDPADLLLGESLGKLRPIRQLIAVLENQDSNLRGAINLEMADSRSATMGLILMKLAGSSINEQLEQKLTWRVDGSFLVGEPFILLQSEVYPWVKRTLLKLQKTSGANP